MFFLANADVKPNAQFDPVYSGRRALPDADAASEKLGEAQ